MTRYVLRRLVMLIPVLFGVSILVFVIMRSLPGDPAVALLGPGANPESIAAVQEDLNLDEPLPVQYLTWLGDMFQGDFGDSFIHHTPVSEQIENRIGPTIELVILGMLVTILIGIPSGLICAVRQNTWLDYTARSLNILGLSVPSFWLATLLLLLPSLWWGYAPPAGYVGFFEDPLTNLEQMYMPALVLGIASGAVVMRMTRSAVLEVMRADFVRTARTKGLRERTVLWRHVMKNSMIPIVSLLGLQIGVLIGGQVIIEQIFSLPGIGRLLVESVVSRDYAVVQAVVLLIALLILLVNLGIDLAYAALDPRIKYS